MRKHFYMFTHLNIFSVLPVHPSWPPSHHLTSSAASQVSEGWARTCQIHFFHLEGRAYGESMFDFTRICQAASPGGYTVLHSHWREPVLGPHTLVAGSSHQYLRFCFPVPSLTLFLTREPMYP